MTETPTDRLGPLLPRRRGSAHIGMVVCFALAAWLVGVGFGKCDVGTPALGTQREAPVADRLAALEMRLAKQDADIRTLQQGLAKAKATVSTLQGAHGVGRRRLGSGAVRPGRTGSAEWD